MFGSWFGALAPAQGAEVEPPRVFHPSGLWTDLQNAVAGERLRDVRHVLGQDPQAAEKLPPRGPLPLEMAVQMAEPELVHLLLEAGADPKAAVRSGEGSLITQAAVRAQPDIVRMLLAAGAIAETRDLLVAVRANDTDSFALVAAALPELAAEELNSFRPLLTAAENKNARLVEMLLKLGVNEEDAVYALRAAANVGATEVVRVLLAAGVPPESRDWALLEAASTGHAGIVKMVLQAGARPQGPLTDTTPLHAAARWGHPLVVELLLDAGAEVDLRDDQGRRPLDLALESQHRGVLEQLLRGGARPPVEMGHPPLTPSELAQPALVADRLLALGQSVETFFLACDAGDLAEVRASATLNPSVLQKKQPRQIDSHQLYLTGLGVACLRGHESIAKWLVAAGADPEVRCELPTSFMDHTGAALHLAVLSGNERLVGELLEAGAPVGTSRVGFGSLVDLAGQQPRILKRLQAALDQQAGHQQALAAAIAAGDALAVQAALAAGARPDMADEQGQTSVHWAAAAGRLAVVEQLIAAGADAGLRDQAGRLPLHLAAREGHRDLAAWLWERQGLGDAMAAVELADAKWLREIIARQPDRWNQTIGGETPLHRAAETNNPELVRILVEAGADPNARDAKGQTPVDVARQADAEPGDGGETVVTLLTAAGGKAGDDLPPVDPNDPGPPVRCMGGLMYPGARLTMYNGQLYAHVENVDGLRIRQFELETPQHRLLYHDDRRDGVRIEVLAFDGNRPAEQMAPRLIYRSQAAFERAHPELVENFRDSLFALLTRNIGSLTMGGGRIVMTAEDRVLLGVQCQQQAEGVLVSSVVPGSNADRAGVTEGDYIVGFNEFPIENFDALRELMGWQDHGDRVTLTVRRGEETLEHVVELRND